MPQRKKFREQESADFTILDGDGSVYGHIRVKPSAILWKPRHEREYYNVKVEVFND